MDFEVHLPVEYRDSYPFFPLQDTASRQPKAAFDEHSLDVLGFDVSDAMKRLDRLLWLHDLDPSGCRLKWRSQLKKVFVSCSHWCQDEYP